MTNFLDNGGLLGKTRTASNTSAVGMWSLAAQQRYKSDGNWVVPYVTPTDDYFKYVTMLLRANGANNANNNTFIDSSTNAFTITRTGNTTQGSFGPYGSNWSNYFDGTTDDITVADNTAFDVGSGDFTIEMWIYPEGQASLGLVFSQNSGSEATSSYDIRYDGNTTLSGYIFISGTGYGVSETVTKNQWQHVAFVRNGNTIRLYVNGTSTTSTSASGTVNNSSTAIYIGSAQTAGGYYFKGYISNVRFVKGTAVYTSNFTPSTTPLTAISGTQLLTCQSNRFIDNSTNAFTITRNGDVSVQRFSPFSPTSSYSTTTIGGSAYFDGTGDVLRAGYNSAFNFGTNSLTLECWVYPTAFNASFTHLVGQMQTNASAAGGIELGITSAGLPGFYASASSGAYAVSITGSAIPLNTWTHIAGVRNGNTFTLYVNGVSVGTATSSVTITQDSTVNYGGLDVGGAYGANLYYLTGYISDARVVNGGAVYTSNFTPSTTPLTAVSNTQLLMNITNAGIFDSSMMNDLESAGNAKISTAQSKFGGSSLYFDGTDDKLVLPSNRPMLALGSGDFTVEMWIYFSTINTISIFDQRPLSTNGNYPLLYINGSQIRWYVNSTDRILGSNLSANTWYHVAVSRSGSSTKMFIDGTQVGSTYTDTTDYLYGYMVIADTSFTSGYYFNGYIDDFRITKGYARYTANFTPPTTTFADQ